jgi:3'-phosphoadenosine 5'-phosphosulfate sulfotransferase (PAPS reductase)/FAD synthetase
VDLESIQKLLEQSGKRNGQRIRTAALLGMLTKDNQIKANIPSKDRSRFSCERYKFLLDCPVPISSKCCNVMKKAPVHEYAQCTGRKPMTAQMASESRLRTQQWLKNGCNGFDMKSPISNPMSFWTEQDVLLYIRENHISICSVYGDVVTDDEEHGQMTLADVSDMGIFDLGRPELHTTGCDRTGCMFCGYGCHLEKSPGRFERMKITHPKQYEFIMRPRSEGGLGYKDVIDWINEHGKLNIKY